MVRKIIIHTIYKHLLVLLPVCGSGCLGLATVVVLDTVVVEGRLCGRPSSHFTPKYPTYKYTKM